MDGRDKMRRLVRLSAAAGTAALLGAGLTVGLLLHAVRQPLDPAPFLEGSASSVIEDRDGRPLYVFLNEDEHWRLPRDLDAISPWLAQATVAVEDQRFHRHRGVDPWAIGRALLHRVLPGGTRSGASTITMQVVKLSTPYEPTVRGKLGQMLLSLRLERHASKEEILAAYLNKAPYGYNLLGAEAAAWRYFGKSARELNLPEAALLAGMPQAPARYQPLRHPEAAARRRNHVLRRMHTEGMLDSQALEQASTRGVGAVWHDLPTAAPHLAMKLRRTLPPGGATRLTLSAPLQARIEALLPRYLRRFDGEVSNAAVMVVDVDTGAVLARIGGANFHQGPGAQVDLCTARRSPGSALKPFTYGLAMERNLLYPSEKLLDDTLDFGAYNPGNFDGTYNGLISAADALGYSLNVPAILTAERVGVPQLQQFLRRLGFATLSRAPEHYGLGLTLGNAEVTLEHLAEAYVALAYEGQHRPLQMALAPVSAASPRPATRVLDRGVALALYEMLEAPFPREVDRDLIRPRGVQPKVAWKTGTSTGYHDAWAVAFNRQYVVAVWVGNSNGRPSRRLIGAHAALPLAAAIFRGLEPGSGKAWPAPGEDLRAVPVCSVSGLPAATWCPNRRTAQFPRAQYLHRHCDVHYPRQAGEAVLARWPGSAHRWDLARVRAPLTPQAGGSQSTALRVRNPVDRAEYLLTGEKHGDRIRLEASTEQESTLSWFLNGRYLGDSTPEEPLFLQLEAGDHRLSCMAPSGETVRVGFSVRSPAR